MISLTNVAILLACILIFALRAYKKGIWQGAFGLLGLLSAYGLSFFFAPKLMSALKGMGLSSTFALFIGMMVAMLTLFILASAFFAYVPGLVFPAIKNVRQKHRYSGAAFGALSGIIVGMLVIWAVGLLSSTVNRNTPLQAGPERKPDLLERASTKLIAGAVRSGMNVVEDDPFKANAAAALISSPQSFSSAFKELARAPQLRDFWEDGETQFYMDQGELDALIAHEKFRALIDTPELQELLEKSRPEEMPQDQAERYLAKQMSFVFRRMRKLRSDQRVVAILEDPEVKALAQQHNPIALLTNEKIQSLVKLVMEDGVSVGELAALKSPQDLAKEATPRATRAPKIIYRWMDDNGKMRYTDEENTPASRLNTAEIITY